MPVWPIFLISILLSGSTGCKPDVTIDNPYAEVNWRDWGRHKADLHAHTSRSDGNFSPNIIVDRYRELGYDILAIADHNLITYPWQEFSTFTPSARAFRLLDEGGPGDLSREEVVLYENRDPEALGMLAIQANEVSQHHHLGSYFSDHPGGTLATVEETLEDIASRNGLAILFHIGLYNGTYPNWPYHPIEWYVDLYQKYDHLIGAENLLMHTFERWDSILIRLMPDRPVWGFCDDDYHRGIMGRRWNVFLLPELSTASVRHAMENGLLYFVHAPEGHDGPSPPAIESIKVNSGRGTINIDATGHEFIEWVSDNKVVHRGDHFNINDFPEVKGYVRAVLWESENGPLTGTQPFGIRRRQ